MTITPVKDWERHWWKARPLMERVCQRMPGITVDEIYFKLRDDPDYQLLMMDDGAAVISLEEDSIHIVGLSGNFPRNARNWADDFTAFVLSIAMILNRPKITLCGRKGWSRALKHLGWRVNGEQLEVFHGRI